MNKTTVGLIAFILCLNTPTFATSGQSYLDKFLSYTQWSQNIPRSADPEFMTFIENPTPLTRKLREKWLYQLAYNKEWATFSQNYQGSTDINLQCYAVTAMYNLGKHEQALREVTALWLHGGSQPIACNRLFSTLLSHHEISDSLIQQRIALALENNQLSLARYLLKQYTPARVKEADLLTSIHQKPKNITRLEPGYLHGEFYLYGLKLLVPHDMDEAIGLSRTALAKKIMSDAQQQSFFAQVALYKAMRDQPDAAVWFAKIKPAFYNEVLLEWQIRYALIHHDWRKIVYLIGQSKNKDEPCDQYWMARALDALGETEKAATLYQTLSEKRNYYGFLASLKVDKHPSFENEPSINNQKSLLPYKLITDQIRNFYQSHQSLQASRLLNDFVSELPKNEKSALASWVANDLHWYGKSVYLSNNDDLNNQLSLRFPLAHRSSVRENAKNFQIPQELIYAVIRQESSFHDDIVSSAGANGLMQLMPGTAQVVAKRASIPYTGKGLLFSPQNNIHIGAAYLQQLAKQYHQHPVLMMAAYNAGPKQVNYWIKNHAPKEVDIWIETLPWRETRNYLKNIIAFYAVYQYRLHEKPSLDDFMQPF